VFLLALVIVDDFHVMAMTAAPNEADPPLVINSNRVLSLPAASQRLQVIPRWGGQVVEISRCMKLEQFPQGDPFDSTKTPAVLVVKKVLGFRRAKTPDHTPMILRHALYVKRSCVGSGESNRTSEFVGGAF
jgi:hypothetical protein